MKMTKQEHVDYWRTSAKNDLDSSVCIFNAGRYDWCLFVGHLALEKILKALFVGRSEEGSLPPKIHNLLRLAELVAIELDDEQKIFLDKINDFNINTRYPDYKMRFHKRCNKQYATKYLKKIKEFYICFNSLLE